MKNAKLRKLLNFKICNLPTFRRVRRGGHFAISNSRRGGFTLIEVIVAIAILAISLVMIMQLFSGGLRASRVSCDYTRAVIHAKDKIEELSVAPVQDSGEFDDGYRWESMVEPYKELEDLDFNLIKIKVKVSWSDVLIRQNSVELVSLKVVPSENEK